MVFVDPKNLGYQPYWDKWVNGFPAENDRKEFQSLYEKYVTKLISYILDGIQDGRQTEKLKTILPITNLNMVKLLCDYSHPRSINHILSILLSNNMYPLIHLSINQVIHLLLCHPRSINHILSTHSSIHLSIFQFIYPSIISIHCSIYSITPIHTSFFLFIHPSIHLFIFYTYR